MTAIELHVISYWRASQALRRPGLAPADRAIVADQLYDLATQRTGRVADMAARIVWPTTFDDGSAA